MSGPKIVPKNRTFKLRDVTGRRITETLKGRGIDPLMVMRPVDDRAPGKLPVEEISIKYDMSVQK